MLSPTSESSFRRTMEMIKRILSFSHASSYIFHEPERALKQKTDRKRFPDMLSAI